MTSTHSFYSCYQKEGQTFAQWKADLCDKLRHCGFTTSSLAAKLRDRALRDMYVIGIRNAKIRQALLKQQDPDLETTEKIIQMGERLQEDIRHFENPVNHHESTVSKIQRRTFNRPMQPDTTSMVKPARKPCETCGADDHVRIKCKYRDYSCNFCKRPGHLERVSRQKKVPPITTKHIGTSFTLNHVNQSDSSSSHTSTVSLLINGHRFSFELDTGSANTIVSITDWVTLGKPTLRSSNLVLTCYSGEPLTVQGECKVTVQLGRASVQVPLVVVSGSGTPLLGLHWIRLLKLDLNQIVHESNHDADSVHKITDDSRLNTILDKYRSVLNKQLGHCTKVKAHIQLQPNAIPRFFKPRPLPFAFLDGVKNELDRQVTLGILQKVDTSPWAAPIVPVVKPNGTIRICGDFKVTINPQICIDQHPIPTVDELLAKLQHGRRFTKIDLSDAYLQLELDDQSKDLVVINTPFGLFRFNWMPFGISNAPAIFQRTIDQVIAGIPNCIAYLDDILLTGTTDAEHFKTLESVLSKLSDFGLRCSPEKCFSSKIKSHILDLSLTHMENGRIFNASKPSPTCLRQPISNNWKRS